MKTWSRLGTERDAIKRQQESRTPSNHFLRQLYGKVRDAQGPESYESEGPKGIRVKIEFYDKTDTIKLDGWYPFDISKDQFLFLFQTIESLKARLEEEPVHVIFEYTPAFIAKGRARLSAFTNDDFTGIEKNPVYTLGSLINATSKKGKVTRIIKASASSKSETAISLTEGTVRIAADGKNFIEVSTEGTTIGGKLNLQMMSSDIKVAGIFAFQNPLFGVIPSTTTTPISQFSLSLPIENIIAFGGIAALLMSLMAK